MARYELKVNGKVVEGYKRIDTAKREFGNWVCTPGTKKELYDNGQLVLSRSFEEKTQEHAPVPEVPEEVSRATKGKRKAKTTTSRGSHNVMDEVSVALLQGHVDHWCKLALGALDQVSSQFKTEARLNKDRNKIYSARDRGVSGRQGLARMTLGIMIRKYIRMGAKLG